MNMKEAYENTVKVITWSIVGIVLALLVSLLTGCTTTKYVTVPEVHEVHHHHTDSIHQTDSVIIEKETTIMQLDSAAMAKYGIQLKAAERAWLVKSWELERQIEHLMAMSETKDSVHDSIPVPYPVEKEVYIEKELNWFQKSLMWSGGIAIITIVVFIFIQFKGFGLWRWIKSML